VAALESITWRQPPNTRTSAAAWLVAQGNQMCIKSAEMEEK